ncbi:MAG: hypothetical protein ABIU05_26015 [Nitrospirales bacterium]
MDHLGFFLRTGCQNPLDNTFFNDPGGGTFSSTNQTKANFSFNTVETETDGGDTIQETDTYTGTIAPDGTVNFSSNYVVTLNRVFWHSGTSTVSDTLLGNTFTGTETGRNLVGDICQWTQMGRDTRSGPVPPPIVLPINTTYDLN